MSHMHGGSTGGSEGMHMFFKAGIPDMPLWFESWVPSSVGTTVGICFGLVALSVLSRLVTAIKFQVERAWKVGVEGTVRLDEYGQEKESTTEGGVVVVVKRVTSPFMLSQELTRGLLGTLQAAILYFIMLALMAFNAYYFISILVGIFVGEVLFGRFAH